MSRIFTASLLLSMLTLSAAAKASSPADGATTATLIRVSTGTTAPELIGSPVLSLPQRTLLQIVPEGAQVGVALTVNANGQPENIRVVKPFSPFVDRRVVETVSQMHFVPGKVDNQPTATDMNLQVTVTH
ncbi:MAG: energy transducer TonB [Acidobacteriaceae bacterium]